MKTFLASLGIVLSLVQGLVATDLGFKETFSDGAGSWEPWAPRSEIAPGFEEDTKVGRSSAGSLMISGLGDEARFGSWKTSIRHFKPGKLYRFEAWYRTDGIENEKRSVIPRLNWKNDAGEPVRPPDFIAGSDSEGEWTQVEYITDAPADATQLEIQLGFGFAA